MLSTKKINTYNIYIYILYRLDILIYVFNSFAKDECFLWPCNAQVQRGRNFPSMVDWLDVGRSLLVDSLKLGVAFYTDSLRFQSLNLAKCGERRAAPLFLEEAAKHCFEQLGKSVECEREKVQLSSELAGCHRLFNWSSFLIGIVVGSFLVGIIVVFIVWTRPSPLTPVTADLPVELVSKPKGSVRSYTSELTDSESNDEVVAARLRARSLRG